MSQKEDSWRQCQQGSLHQITFYQPELLGNVLEYWKHSCISVWYCLINFIGLTIDGTNNCYNYEPLTADKHSSICTEINLRCRFSKDTAIMPVKRVSRHQLLKIVAVCRVCMVTTNKPLEVHFCLVRICKHLRKYLSNLSSLCQTKLSRYPAAQSNI